jgi:hypothetical protein
MEPDVTEEGEDEIPFEELIWLIQTVNKNLYEPRT